MRVIKIVFLHKFIPLACFCFLFSCSRVSSDFYSGIEHKGEKDIQIREITLDSLYLDASMTSFSGQWLISEIGNKIFFVDNNAVGVSIYDLDGTLNTIKIAQGRGPKEMISPSCGSTFDSSANLVLLDRESSVHIYDSRIENKLFYSQQSFFVLLDEDFGNSDWEDLYNTPNPEVAQMYEYNLMVNRLGFSYDRLFLPISTEHISYNLFDVSANARDCWATSYILMSFVPNNISGTKRLIGHYPKIYTTKNIPIFGLYDFAVSDNKIYVSFNADPKIYVLDVLGTPLYSFGEAEEDIKLDYPQTKSFDEYDEEWSVQRKKYGYYDKIYKRGDILLRTCKTDSGVYKLQVYKGEQMIGDIVLERELKKIGQGNDNYYYAYVRNDFDNDRFVLVKFLLGV